MTILVLQQAEKLFRAGKQQEAIILLEKHMVQSPEDRQAASVLGRIYINIKQPDRAAFWLKHSLQLGRQRAVIEKNTERCESSDPVLDQDDLEYLYSNRNKLEEYDCSDEYGLHSEEPVDDSPEDTPEGAQRDDPGRVEPTHPGDLTDTSVVRSTTQSDCEGGAPPEKPATVALTHDADKFEEIEFDDDLEGIADIEPDAHASIDWQEYALDEDLIDTVSEELVEEAIVSRMSALERARQVAARLAAEADWCKQQIPILVDVLASHKSHGKTIEALKTLLIEDLVTPAELAIMHDLRLRWGGGGYNRDYRFNEAVDGWPNVSWQQALRLLRCLAVDNADEIILFVDDCFDDWCRNEGLLRAYPKFVFYLNQVVENTNGTAVHAAAKVSPYIDYSLFNDEDDYYDTWRVHGTQLPYHLQIEGLFTDEDFVN